jgi:hypothetical protein
LDWESSSPFSSGSQGPSGPPLNGRRFLKKFPELPITLLKRGDNCKKDERVKTFSDTGDTDFFELYLVHRLWLNRLEFGQWLFPLSLS